MREKTVNLKMKNLKPLKESLSSHYTHSLKKQIPVDESRYYY